MQVTINLTAVLVTLIICVTIYAMCKMARKDETKKKQTKTGKVTEFVNDRKGM